MEAVIQVSDLRMRYGSTDVLNGVAFTARPRRGPGPARPERRGQDHHHRDPRGLPDALGRAGAGARRRPGARRTSAGGRGSAWCCSPGVTTASGASASCSRTSARTTRLLDRPRSPAVGRRRTDRGGRPDRARAQADQHALRRAAPPAGRGDRHRRAGPSCCSWTSRRPGFDPAGPARVPRPGAPAGRHRGHHDPAHHPRPGRGGEAGRPHPHPGRRPDHRGRLGRRAVPADGRRGRGALDPRRQRFVHSAADATGFVRELFRQYGDAIADLEVRRASLEDTYMALVQKFETGQGRRRRRRSRRSRDERHA